MHFIYNSVTEETKLPSMFFIPVLFTSTFFILCLCSKELRSIKGLAAVQGLLWCMLGAMCRLMLLLVVLVAVDMQGKVSLRAVFTTMALLDVLMWCLHRFPVPAVRHWLTMQNMLTNVQVSQFTLLFWGFASSFFFSLHFTYSVEAFPLRDWVLRALMSA